MRDYQDSSQACHAKAPVELVSQLIKHFVLHVRTLEIGLWFRQANAVPSSARQGFTSAQMLNEHVLNVNSAVVSAPISRAFVLSANQPIFWTQLTQHACPNCSAISQVGLLRTASATSVARSVSNADLCHHSSVRCVKIRVSSCFKVIASTSAPMDLNQKVFFAKPLLRWPRSLLPASSSHKPQMWLSSKSTQPWSWPIFLAS